MLTEWTLGIVFIVLVAILWTGGSMITQYIYNDLDFRSPFVVTYVSTSLFSLYLPMWMLLRHLGRTKYHPWKRDERIDEHEQHLLRREEQEEDNKVPLNCGSSGSGNCSSDVEATASSACPAVTVLLPGPVGGDVHQHQQSIEEVEKAHSRLQYSDRQGGTRDSPDPMRGPSSYAGRLQEWVLAAMPPPMQQAKHNHQTHSGGTVQQHQMYHRVSHPEIFRLSVVLAVLWFVGNCLYSYSLMWTSIANSTIISNMSGVFTLFFSSTLRLEQVSWAKLCGVLLCFIGVVVVTLDDQRSGDDDGSGSGGAGEASESVMGDIFALLSALCYGAYTTYLRYHVPREEVVSMQLVLGYMGVVCAVLFAPCLVLVIYAHIDNLAHFSGMIFLYLVFTGLFDYVVSDYLWARAVVLTTPTVATVGLSITIPLAFVADALLNNSGTSAVTVAAVLGSGLVMVGFVLLNIEGMREDGSKGGAGIEGAVGTDVPLNSATGGELDDEVDAEGDGSGRDFIDDIVDFTNLLFGMASEST